MRARTPGAVTRAINGWQLGGFEYGRRDCCTFAAFVVCQVTGRDLMRQLTYQGEAEAAALLDRFGGLEAAVAHQLGAAAVATGRLRPADLVLWQARGREGLGVALRSAARNSMASPW